MFAFFRHLIVVFFVLMCSIFLYDDYADYSLSESYGKKDGSYINSNVFGNKEYIGRTKINEEYNDNIITTTFGTLPNIESVLTYGERAFYNAMSVEKTTYRVRSGDTIISILKRNGLDGGTINKIIYELDKDKKFAKLRVGEEIEIGYKLDNLVFLAKKIANNKFLVLSEGDSGFVMEEKVFEIKKQTILSSGTIDSSLYNTAIDMGLSPRQIKQVVDIFKWKFDVSSQVRKGDFFIIEYDVEKIFDEVIGYGKINAILFKTKNKDYYAIRYKGSNNESYYNLEGESLEKVFNRYPVKNPRITSSFSLSRLHPILKIRRPHKGTDFGGHRGTPIMTTGDGVVTFAGRNGGYGNFIRIKHGNGYETSYAHLHRIKVKRGESVKRGQVIGEMGSTGRSTGNHLHFELKINGRVVNPMRVDLPDAPYVGDQKEFKNIAKKYKLNFEVLEKKKGL